MAKFTTKQLLLIIGALFILLGTGYNIYGWNTNGKTDYNLQILGLFIMGLALFVKKKDIES